MNTQFAETSIPTYSLTAATRNQASLFLIKELTGENPLLKDIFLTPHRKDYYLFAFIKQGNNRHWVDMVPYNLKPDCFYFTLPHQVHIKESMNPALGYILCFTDQFLMLSNNHDLLEMPIIQNRHNGHELTLNDKDVLFMEDIMAKLVKESRQQAHLINDMLHAYMRVLITYLNRLYKQQFENILPGVDRDLLNRFRTLVESNFTKVHDVASYAGMINISAGHMSEVIKQQSGKPAIEHIHERILLEAESLLFHTMLTVTEIAYQLGFTDASYFVRFFKRMAGQTPLAFRNSTRKMYHPNPYEHNF